MLLCAYTTYVRPLLEYNTVIWSPSLKCDVTAVEKVQRRFRKRLPGFRNLSYAERRSELNLTSLPWNLDDSTTTLLCAIKLCLILSG